MKNFLKALLILIFLTSNAYSGSDGTVELSKSSGKKISFKGKELIVNDLEKFDFSKVTIAFFAAGSDIAEKWAYKVAETTIVIIVSTSFINSPTSNPIPKINHLSGLSINPIPSCETPNLSAAARQ